VKLRDLAEQLACRLDGDGEIDIVRVAGIQHAQPGDLTFLAHSKYESAMARTRASAILLRDEAPSAPCAMLRTADPYLVFARAVAILSPVSWPAPGVHAMAVVADDACLGQAVSIGAFVSIGEGAVIGDRTIVFPNVTIGPGVRLGADCVVHSNVSLRERVVIGNRVVLQNGAVVGSDGYGFVRRSDGTHEKIPQVATVVIEDDVELGANSTVDRPAVGETRIGSGTKIDNLAQIGHGVTVGRNVLMAAQVGVAGSTEVGDDVIFGGQVGVSGHLTIGRGTVAVAKSGITNSIDPGTTVGGYPAIDLLTWRKASVLLKRLPELKRRIKDLEARLAAVTSGGGPPESSAP
jgi:UDP-3-O-[3-hydroxymyristoyl] glucosamine N-acyltransferase